jgi:hypothetical protein
MAEAYIGDPSEDQASPSYYCELRAETITGTVAQYTICSVWALLPSPNYLCNLTYAQIASIFMFTRNAKVSGRELLVCSYLQAKYHPGAGLSINTKPERFRKKRRPSEM